VNIDDPWGAKLADHLRPAASAERLWRSSLNAGERRSCGWGELSSVPMGSAEGAYAAAAMARSDHPWRGAAFKPVHETCCRRWCAAAGSAWHAPLGWRPSPHFPRTCPGAWSGAGAETLGFWHGKALPAVLATTPTRQMALGERLGSPADPSAGRGELICVFGCGGGPG